MSVLIDQAERQYLIARYMTEGRDTYAGRLPAWHQLGAVVGKFATSAELLPQAKADFAVFKSQLHDGLGRPVESWGIFRWDYADKAKGDKQATKFLANCGKDYASDLDHVDLMRVCDSLVGNMDGAHYETMGCIDFGRQVWAQINPNFAIRVGEDVSDIYLTMRTSYDGSVRTSIYETMTRAVCRNTARIGFMKKLSATLSTKKTKHARARVNDWVADLQEVRIAAMAMQDKLNFLAGKRMVKDTLVSVLDRLFPKQTDDDGKEYDTPRRTNILGEILESYEYNDADTFPEQRGTSYNLLQAITGYVDHGRSSRNGSRAESALFGSGDKLKTQALELILEQSEGLPNSRVPVSYLTGAQSGSQSSEPVTSLLDSDYWQQSELERRTSLGAPCVTQGASMGRFTTIRIDGLKSELRSTQ